MYIGARPPLEKTGLQGTNPRVFTRKGSMNSENLKKKQPTSSEATQIYKIESRIYKMIYIVALDF